MQTLFDTVIQKKLHKKGGALDLANLRDIFTHSYHQERFIEMMLRGFEESPERATEVGVRLINDHAFQEKYSCIGLRLS